MPGEFGSISSAGSPVGADAWQIPATELDYAWIAPPQGFVGTVIAMAASISTGATGFIFGQVGHLYGFVILAGAATAATGLLWTAMPETKPGKYLD